MFNRICCMVGLVTVVVGDMVDMQPYKQLILDESNKFRNDSSMENLVWGDKLQDSASNWIKDCEYERPKLKMPIWKFIMKITKSRRSIEDIAKCAIRRGKEKYLNSTQWKNAAKIGCAITKCKTYSYRGSVKCNVSILLCFYERKTKDSPQLAYTRSVPIE